MKEILVAFLPADSSLLEESWLNRGAAKVAPPPKSGSRIPVVHCEIVLEDGLALSICYNKVVHLHKKKFSRVHWSFRSLQVTDAQYRKVLLFAEAHKGCTFNSVGFFGLAVGLRWAGTWPQRFGWKRRFFCGEICTAALQAAGVIPSSQESVLHPEELLQLLDYVSTRTSIRDNYEEIKY